MRLKLLAACLLIPAGAAGAWPAATGQPPAPQFRTVEKPAGLTAGGIPPIPAERGERNLLGQPAPSRPAGERSR